MIVRPGSNLCACTNASLNVAADRASLVHWTAMNRECWRRRAGAINVQKCYLPRRTRKRASAILTARCDDQSCLGEFRERFPHEGSAFTLSARVAEGISLPRKKPRAAIIWAATVN